MNRENLSRLRKEYLTRELRRRDLEEDPHQMFVSWLKEAIEHIGEDANAMALSTVDERHRPSCRMVLLKDMSPYRYFFYTNYESRKASDMEANSSVSLLFWWPTLERQIRIEGVVQRAEDDRSDQYFTSRSEGSKVGAIASPQSRVLEDRTELDLRVQAVMEDYRDLKRPVYWGGYVVEAHYFEFWQGRASRLHDRFGYERVSESGEEFRISRLAP